MHVGYVVCIPIVQWFVELVALLLKQTVHVGHVGRIPVGYVPILCLGVIGVIQPFRNGNSKRLVVKPGGRCCTT
jgi:hypothetical protein